MGKSFKNKSVYDNLVASKSDTPKAAEINNGEIKSKRRVGRPKTKDVKGTCKNINVAIPIVLLNQWEEVKMLHNSNLTEYVTKLIEKDMSENYDTYKNIINNLNNIK